MIRIKEGTITNIERLVSGFVRVFIRLDDEEAAKPIMFSTTAAEGLKVGDRMQWREEITPISDRVRSETNTKKETKQIFTASVWQEGDWFVAQCREFDVASQGETEEEALQNLSEALELHFEEPMATITPHIRMLEVEVAA